MSAAGVNLSWEPWAGGPQGGSTTSLPPHQGFTFDTANPIVPALWTFGYIGTVLNGGALGPIVRYQLAQFADRTFSPTHVAHSCGACSGWRLIPQPLDVIAANIRAQRE
jgi:hypothetical protein